MRHPELMSFRRDWVLLNTRALLAGYVLYTPIAHGFTGGHASRQLSSAQLAAHSIALVVVALLVATAQRRALAGFVSPAVGARHHRCHRITSLGSMALTPILSSAFWC
jgi:hypothetical protein